MSRHLEGKTAIITGSTGGLGVGMAEALAGAGAKVMLNGMGDPDEIEALRARIAGESGVEVAYDPADLMKPADVAGMVERTEERWGSVDVLCNNGGVWHVAPTEELTPEHWDAQIATLLSAPFHAIRAALPGMKARGWGRIVNTSSTSGLRGSVEKSGYCAAKHGVIGLTKVVALETAECGITCNAICPGWVLTGMSRPQIDVIARQQGLSHDEAMARMAGSQPTRQFVTKEQIGALVAFLCTDAASQITGASIPIDAGMLAR
ncbi:MAG: 3-hydroxybutyrate dehydrogenase [Rhodospirillaceae bacterium]|jgi:3-hydroxybutyrate dehydrogenase|nr:3-hydroxybutyrate dehydrogenase [Rhodospirillaceae bacterium]MBT5413049.1 3-hydroxybutyrate dehydrogenase [Rhodospirillaceae bacterium]MBT6117827.1 3-hydroxybutyrate dehydrogenase [Rhodospirillaceae bacterium]